jgi:hypothetical protein
MKIFWGFVLVVLGFTYLGAGLGWWGYDVVNTLWQFWPLILVFWGLDLLTRNTGFYIPLMIIAVILSGALIYVGVYNKQNNLNWFGARAVEESTRTEVSASLPKGAKSAQVRVDTGAIDFKISGDSKNLLEGFLESNFSKPEITENLDGTIAKVSLSTINSSRVSMWNMGPHNFKNLLDLKINKSVPVSLIVKSGASSLDFDLSALKLYALDIDTGASSVNVRVGSEVVDGAKLAVDAGASSIRFRIPSEVGVKIVSETGLTSRNFEGYTERDGAWYSAGYDSAKKKVELNLQVGASSITVGK